MYRYLSILLFSILLIGSAGSTHAQTIAADEDTVAVQKPKKIEAAGHQLCLGFDLMRVAMNYAITDRYGYELAVDYYLKNEFYAVAEGGWGGSKMNYPDLKYTTTNNFYRIGFNKEILARNHPTDWDMMFFGLRAAYAGVSRSAATFTIVDSVWGSVPGTAPAKNFPAIWLELAGGMRVELLHGLFAGWTVREKFIMNGRSFNDLSPLYIAGFGKGDKTTNFDFNVYLSYGIRWKRKGVEVKNTPAPTK